MRFLIVGVGKQKNAVGIRRGRRGRVHFGEVVGLGIDHTDPGIDQQLQFAVQIISEIGVLVGANVIRRDIQEETNIIQACLRKKTAAFKKLLHQQTY